jgi:Mn2+/Fe2+ NRAMP family transporter
MLISPFFVPIINMSLKKKLPHPLVNNMAILLGSVLLSVLIGAATSKILNIDDSKETTLMKRIVNWNQSSSAATVFAYLIPLLSGVVIAIAYKNQNVISMVGAGIAISLLPPFVNTGLYLGQNADKKFEVSQSFKFGMVNLIAGIIGYGATVQYFRR